MSELRPEVGEWYQNVEDGRLFEVVAIDEEEDTIEIQYFESDLEGLDFDTWKELPLAPGSAPEDWTGPYDDLSLDDLGDTEENRSSHNKNNPLKDVIDS